MKNRKQKSWRFFFFKGNTLGESPVLPPLAMGSPLETTSKHTSVTYG